MTLEHRLTFTRPSSAWQRLLLGPGDHSHSLRRGCCSARRSRRPRAVPKRDRFDSARDLVHLHARRDRREKGFVRGRASLLTTGGLTCRFGHASPFTPHDHRLVSPCPRMRGALATERTSEPGGTKHHLGQSWAQVDPPSTVAQSPVRLEQLLLKVRQTFIPTSTEPCWVSVIRNDFGAPGGPTAGLRSHV